MSRNTQHVNMSVFPLNKTVRQSMDSQATVTIWEVAPQMDCGCPMPNILSTDNYLFVAYLVSNAQENLFAVIRFERPMQFIFGYPDDEAFAGHPIDELGIEPYAFNIIENSPYVSELSRRNSLCFPGTKYTIKHWVVTFHDETLEVVCNKAKHIGNFVGSSAIDVLIENIA